MFTFGTLVSHRSNNHARRLWLLWRSAAEFLVTARWLVRVSVPSEQVRLFPLALRLGIRRVSVDMRCALSVDAVDLVMIVTNAFA